MEKEKQLQKELTEQDIVCAANIISAAIHKEDIVQSCKHCEFFGTCFIPEENIVADYLDTMRKHFERVWGVWIGSPDDEAAIRTTSVDEREKAEKKELEKRAFALPAVQIRNDGCRTSIYVEGKKLEGVTRLEFIHDAKDGHIPKLRLDLMADPLCIDSICIPDQPERYFPSYVSTLKLEEAGVLTLEELNELLAKGVLEE